MIFKKFFLFNNLDKNYFKFSILSNYLRISISIISNLVFLPILINKLGLSDYGVYIFVFSFTYLAIFFDLGIGRFIIIKLVSTNLLKFKIWIINITNLISIIFGIFAMILVLITLKIIDPNILELIKPAERNNLYLISSLIILLSVISSFQRSILEGLQKFYINNFSIIIFNIINYSFLFTFINFSSKLNYLALSPVLTFIMIIFFQYFFITKVIKIKFFDMFSTKKNKLQKLNKSILVLVKNSKQFMLQGLMATSLNPLFRFVSYGIVSEIKLISVIDISLRVGAVFSSLINSISIPFFSYFAKLGNKNIKKVAKIANLISLFGLFVIIAAFTAYTFLPSIEVFIKNKSGLTDQYYFGALSIIFSLSINSLFDIHFRAMLALKLISDLILIRSIQYFLFLAIIFLYFFVNENIFIFFLSFSIPIIYFGIFSFFKLNNIAFYKFKFKLS